MPAGGFRPGSGRKKGTKNKRSSELLARLDALDHDPFEAMVRIAKRAEAQSLTDEKDALAYLGLAGSMNKEIAQYKLPKLKSIEHKGDEEAPIYYVDTGIRRGPKDPLLIEHKP